MHHPVDFAVESLTAAADASGMSGVSTGLPWTCASEGGGSGDAVSDARA